MRWAAPANITAIHLASGSLDVVDGYVEAPDQPGLADISGLRANGFTPERETAPVEQPVTVDPPVSEFESEA